MKICIDKELPSTLRSRALAEVKKVWEPGQTITVSFHSGGYFSNNADLIRKTVKKWESVCNLRFEFVENETGMIRIAFDSRDGSWSYVGQDCLHVPANKPTMNFGWLDEPVILHEFGHAIGLGHEHQNPEGGIQWDRNAVIRDLTGPPNYWSIADVEHNVLNRYSQNQVVGTQLDPVSIMMYAIPASWTLNGFSTGFNEDISFYDKQLVESLYPLEPEVLTHPLREAAVAVFKHLEFTKRDWRRLTEEQIVRIGLLTGADVNSRLRKAENIDRVIKSLNL